MKGLSPKLPVQRSTTDGYALTKTYTEMVLQNLKNLLLTVPGERMMDPNYGVGLRRYLFEQDSPSLKADLQKVINKQVKIYLSHVEIRGIVIITPSDIEDMSENSMQLRIDYAIPSMKEIAFLDIDITHK